MANSVYVLRVTSIDSALQWYSIKGRRFLIIGVDYELSEVYVDAGPWAHTSRHVENQSWCIDKVRIKNLLY